MTRRSMVAIRSVPDAILDAGEARISPSTASAALFEREDCPRGGSARPANKISIILNYFIVFIAF
jgi:hypothetical protein